MSAVAVGRETGRAGRPSLGRLIAVELRKTVDTRAGFWLMAAMALLGLVAGGVGATVVDSSDQTMNNVFALAAAPPAILLSVVGVLAVTSEWSQRTALSTFTLVPRRGRVAAAKLIAAVAVAVAATGAALVLSVVVSVLFGASGGLSATLVGYTAISLVLGIVGGAAFGMLFLNSPVAIVMVFALPTVWGLLGGLISGLEGAARWLDQSRTMEPLSEPQAMSGLEWDRLGVSVAVWILLPLLVGAWRLMRKEIS